LPKVPDYICELPDGRRVRYSLKTRSDSDCYFVCFRDANNRRRELNTGETAKHKAVEAAPQKIVKDYAGVAPKSLSWDEATTLMVEHMTAEKLRAGTIQQYELAIGALRKVFPDSHGPADITPAMAERFKVKRSKMKRGEVELSPRTVEGNLKNLSIAYNWWCKRCKVLSENPFEEVTPPKYDKTPPRIVRPDEKKGLIEWLEKRWQKWRLPSLLLEVKATIGCRIGELCSATPDSLRDGRLYFTSETTKGRRQRACKLPPALYDELKAAAGPTYVFEGFSEQLRGIYKRRGESAHAKTVKAYTPARLKRWIQDEVKLYFTTTGKERFKLHNLRATAMTRAREAGIPVDDAAVAFGCNPATMKQYYLAPDEEAIADSVFDRLGQ